MGTKQDEPQTRQDAHLLLRQIGLSKEAIKLYELIEAKGALTARAASAYTGDFASAEYRLFYLLESKGLVRRIGGRPVQFVSLPLNEGLKTSLVNMEYTLSSILKTNQDQMTEQVKIIIGRQALYDEYEKLARQAKHDIRIFAIGIAYSESLAKTQRDAIKRGVRISHVIQQRKVSNLYVIDKWLRAGVKLRYLKGPRGYHINIFDDTSALVTFSDPGDTENRITILTTNPSVVAIFIAQFNSLWAESQPITA